MHTYTCIHTRTRTPSKPINPPKKHQNTQIWASAPFTRPGPLLQNSLENRATRARGANPLLLNRIVPELPLLDATLEGVPDTIYQGEMVRATLRVTNRGRAPAAHIYVKSHPPSWVFLRDPTAAGPGKGAGAVEGGDGGGGVGGEGEGAEVRMSMVGVSGTVFRVDPAKANGSSSPFLAPGQTLAVPLWVRGLGGGTQALRLLLRYERATHAQAPAPTMTMMGPDPQRQQQGHYRYAHVAAAVCVLPSVAVAPSVSPSYARPGECVLSLNVTNYRADGCGDSGGGAEGGAGAAEAGARRRVELHSVGDARVCVCLCGWAFGSFPSLAKEDVRPPSNQPKPRHTQKTGHGAQPPLAPRSHPAPSHLHLLTAAGRARARVAGA